MPRDSSDFFRQAVIAAWKGHAPLTALVPADRISPPQPPPAPEWPWLKFGVPIVRPFGASCLDGCNIVFAGQAYAETTGTGAQTVDGEPRAREIGAAMVDALAEPIDLQPFGCPYPATAHVTWTDTQVIQDGTEADRFRAIVGFDVTISS